MRSLAGTHAKRIADGEAMLVHQMEQSGASKRTVDAAAELYRQVQSAGIAAVIDGLCVYLHVLRSRNLLDAAQDIYAATLRLAGEQVQ